jgi:hypothetical protein
MQGGFRNGFGSHSGGFDCFTQESTLGDEISIFIEEIRISGRKWIPGGFPGEIQFR